MSEPRRRYPQDWLAAQVLGTVGTDNYGLSGIEQSHEEQLHGDDGKRKIVRDALGKPISLVEQKRDVPGEDLRLTIDAAIQERVESVLAGVGADVQAEGRDRARARPAQRRDPRARQLAARERRRPRRRARVRAPEPRGRRVATSRARRSRRSRSPARSRSG